MRPQEKPKIVVTASKLDFCPMTYEQVCSTCAARIKPYALICLALEMVRVGELPKKKRDSFVINKHLFLMVIEWGLGKYRNHQMDILT